MKVLAYHKIKSQNLFLNQIKYLVGNYNLLRLSEIDFTSKKDMILTVDDGDPSFYRNAFPVLKNYKIPAILFVITDLIGTDKPYWWDEIEYYLGKNEGNKKVWEVKSWSNNERERYLKNLRISSQKPELKFKQLTISQLREMQGEGIIIANHSHTHPMYDRCTEVELEDEIKLSTSKLKELGFTPDIFAYPNGNYSMMAEGILENHGVKMAFLFDHKINSTQSNPMRISRLIVNDTTPLWKFKFILSGLHSKILPAIKLFSKILKK